MKFSKKKYDPDQPLPLRYLLPLAAIAFAIMIYGLSQGWWGMGS